MVQTQRAAEDEAYPRVSVQTQETQKGTKNGPRGSKSYPQKHRNDENNSLTLKGDLLEYPIRPGRDIWIHGSGKPGAARTIFNWDRQDLSSRVT